MKINTKLKLNSLAVLTLLVLHAAVAIFLIQRIMGDVRQLTEVEEPLEEAVLEMEINTGETARAVLDYIRTHQQRHIDRMKDSEADFERYAKEFERLAETGEERELGRQVAELYLEFKTLCDEITSASKQRNATLQTLRATTDEIDKLLDDSLTASIDPSSPDAPEKTRAASLMDEILDKSIGELEAYVAYPSPALRQELIDVEVNFNRYLAQYRATRLSADEEKWLGVIEKGFAEAVTAGNEIVALTDELNEKLAKFEADLVEIDRILDDKVQPLIHAETVRAEQDAERSGQISITLIIVAGLFIFAIVAGVGGLVSEGIVDATGRLTEGAAEFGRGNLDHRIEAQTADELGALAAAFNEMADKRKQAETDLRTRTEYLDAILLNLPVGVAILEGPDFRYFRINHTLAEINGLPIEEHLGRPLAEILPDAAPDIVPGLRQVLETGVASPRREFSTKLPKDPQEVRQFSVAFFPMIGEDGKPRAVGAVVVDITERKQAEEALLQNEENLQILVEERTAALRESEERYRSLMEATTSIIWTTDASGGFVVPQPSWEKYTGQPWDEYRGFGWTKKIHPDDTEHVLKAWEKSLREISLCETWGRVWNEPLQEWRNFEVKAVPVMNLDGSVREWVGHTVDITERKRAEEEKRTMEAELRHAQKMEAVGQLASGVAHEFNNLLVGIRGNAELLINTSSDLLSEQSCTALKDIERAGARAYALTNQLLSFARKKSPHVRVFDVNRVVTDGKRMFVRLISSGITLNTVASADPALVCADEVEIEQVILNLVLNARDAMPERGTITIRTRVVTLADRDVPDECKAGHFVELSVSDDGCGMPPETSERIFEPFFTTKLVGEGTGLGLSVAYSDVSKHGGFVAVDSREGVGTVVSVFLPQATESVAEAPAETVSPSTDSVGGDETILVCDDEDIVRSSVNALLQSVGYSVIAVESAADALAAAEANDRKISLLLTDVTMPEMDGFELGREINQRHPDMKVLYSSGYAADQVAAGDDLEVLLKGGPTRELLQRVRQLLDDGKPSGAETASNAAQG